MPELEEVELLELDGEVVEDELDDGGELLELEDEEIPDDEELEDETPEDELDVDEELELLVLEEDELEKCEELDELLVLEDDELLGTEDELLELEGAAELELDGFQGVPEVLELVGGGAVLGEELLDELDDELLELLGGFDELLEDEGLFEEEELLMVCLQIAMMSLARIRCRILAIDHAMSNRYGKYLIMPEGALRPATQNRCFGIMANSEYKYALNSK